MKTLLSTLPILFVLGACSFSPNGSGKGRNPDGVSTLKQAVQICQGPDTVPGIDVSDWQGQIDWDQVATAGYGYAIARINDGNHMDGYFGRNWAEIKRIGLIRGAYQFYEPALDSAWQANVVVQAVGALGAGDLPVTLDVEWPTIPGTPTVQGIQTWIDIVTAGTGKKPMIYTAAGYWNSYFSTEFGNVTLWVANYQTNCPHLPSSWQGWLFWQPNGAGVPGIAGNVDQDLFNGTLAELHRLADFSGSNHCDLQTVDNCGHFGCSCADDNCGGGFCPGTGCSADSINACGYFGCGCVDGQCNGGYCPGTGCTVKETNDCGGYGCGCVDHQCNGVFCPGKGCTAKEMADCGNYGCNCVDHKCNGGFCAGSGCTIGESLGCQNQGCGCVDHVCAGGSCAGSGCTAREALDCTNASQGCAMGSCVAQPGPDAGTVPASGPDASTPSAPGLDASTPPAPGPDASAVRAPGPDAGTNEPASGADADEAQPPEIPTAAGPDASTARRASAHDAGVSTLTTSGGCSSAPGADPALLEGLLCVLGACSFARRRQRGSN